MLNTVTHKIYGTITLKNIKAEFFYHSPQNSALECQHPHPIKLEKKNSSHQIIAYEQSSVALFSICIGAVISLLPPAAVGSLFLRLPISIFCLLSTMEKDRKGGRMMVLTESPIALENKITS